MESIKIIAISDTHGNRKAVDKLKPLIDENDILIHLGDGYKDISKIRMEEKVEVHFVEGNCDVSFFNDSEKLLDIGGVKTLITHGDKYGVKRSLHKLYLRAKELGANLVFYGHTHKALITEEDGVTFINPGSLSEFEVNKSFAYVVIANNKVFATINNKFYN